MNRRGGQHEIVRLSVSNWLALLLAIASAVGIMLSIAHDFTGEVKERLARVETRVENTDSNVAKLWRLFGGPLNDLAGR